MALSKEDREAMLAEPQVCVVAVAGEDGRGPLATPVWYDYRPGGDALVFTGADSRKGRLIRRAGRFTLLVQRTAPTYRYVSVEGPATFAPVTREAVAGIVSRYLPADAVPGYVDNAMSGAADLAVIRLTPEHWTSADIPLS